MKLQSKGRKASTAFAATSYTYGFSRMDLPEGFEQRLKTFVEDFVEREEVLKTVDGVVDAQNCTKERIKAHLAFLRQPLVEFLSDEKVE